MVDFLSPGIKAQIVRKGPLSLPGVATDIGGFAGICERGPINNPQLLTGPDLFTTIFGKQLTGSFLAEAVRDFFNEGGQQCYVNRISHYSDITNRTALTALAAGVISSTVSGIATSGSETSGASAFPAVLVNGDTFTGSVNGGGAVTATVQATNASKTGTAGTFTAPTAAHFLQVSIAGVLGGAIQTISFAGTENTLALYLQAINNSLVGGSAVASGGQIKIQTDQMGSGAGGSIGAGSSSDVLTATGLTTGAFANAGPNNVVNVSAVQASELATLFNGVFTGSTTTALTAGQVAWVSGTTGTTSSVQFTAGTGPAKITGFDTALHSGSAAGGAVSTAHFYAASPGAYGNSFTHVITLNNLVVATVAAAVAAGTISQLTVSTVARIAPGDTISIVATGGTVRGIVQSTVPSTNTIMFATPVTVPTGGFAGTESVVDETFNLTVQDLTTGTTALNGIWTNLRMSPLAGANYFSNAINGRAIAPITVTDLISGVSDPRPAATTSPVPYTGGSDGGTVTDVDFVGNQGAKTGVWAFDLVDDVNFVSCPGISTVATIQGQQAYGESRQEVLIVPDIPQGMTPQQCVAFVQTTANMASLYEATYFPWVRMIDIVSGTVISVPPSGHVQGVYARVGKTRNYGKAPAGTVDGKLNNVLDVDYTVMQSDYDLLYPANINAIQALSGEGICVFGSRTLDPTGEFGQINVVRTFLTLKRQLRTKTRFVNFEPNNADTQGTVVRVVTSTLRLMREAKILQGAKDSDAFFVVCDATNNTPIVVQSGKLICRIGLAVNRPAEFVEYDLENDVRAVQAQLANIGS